jgi:hypothetical protein
MNTELCVSPLVVVASASGAAAPQDFSLGGAHQAQVSILMVKSKV